MNPPCKVRYQIRLRYTGLKPQTYIISWWSHTFSQECTGSGMVATYAIAMMERLCQLMPVGKYRPRYRNAMCSAGSRHCRTMLAYTPFLHLLTHPRQTLLKRLPTIFEILVPCGPSIILCSIQIWSCSRMRLAHHHHGLRNAA